MRKSFIYTFLGVALLSATACEKEIDLNLNGNDNKYVIEAGITDQDGGCTVKISRTKDFDADNEFAGVSGAKVQIFHGTDTTLLTESAVPGVYFSGLVGTSGTTYGLIVNINGEIMTATSTMPAKVNMDDLYFEEEDIFGDITRVATVGFSDPAEQTNYYRFVQYLGAYKVNQYYVRNDDLTNGNKIAARLYIFDNDSDDDDQEDDDEIDSGETVTVEMQNIDANVYKYFYSLSNSATGDSDAATPANPVSNIHGNAIGYFSAYTVQKMSILAP